MTVWREESVFFVGTSSVAMSMGLRVWTSLGLLHTWLTGTRLVIIHESSGKALPDDLGYLCPPDGMTFLLCVPDYLMCWYLGTQLDLYCSGRELLHVVVVMWSTYMPLEFPSRKPGKNAFSPQGDSKVKSRIRTHNFSQSPTNHNTCMS
jgi:hypothetical protein